TFDYGLRGFEDTLRNLQSNGIATSGAGFSQEEALKQWNTILRGQQTSIISIGAYPRENNGFDGGKQAAAGENRPGILWNTQATIEALSKSFTENSFDIVMVHGGYEWSNEPDKSQVEFYRKLIDLGADLVVGSHPHVLQGIEAYQGRLIAYSLGNFLFPGMAETRFGQETVILSLGIYKGKVIYTDPIPVKIDNRTISIDTSGMISKRLQLLIKSVNQ
ncbi:MAG: CapA family protein, partial [Spirochaetota bacterium]